MLKEYKLYKGKIIIRFDDERHRFWDEKGNPITSVTAISGMIDKSNFLIPWALKLMRNYLIEKIDKGEQITILDINEASKESDRVKKKAGDIGTQIHEWINQWLGGKKPAVPDDDKIRNGITAFLQFQRANKVRWIESERVVYSKKYGFAGFLDAVGKIGNKLIMVDFKSSNRIYSEFALQTAGYQIAYEEEIGKEMDSRLVIRFGKNNGEFEFKKYEENKKDKEAFLALQIAKRRMKELK